MKTLAAYHSSNSNCYDFLRLLAASSVIFSHCFDLTLNTDPSSNWLHSYNANVLPGVLGFFIISGFLITESYQHRSDPFLFLKCRILRIFPTLIASVLFSAFVIGLITTSFPPLTYLTNSTVYTFIVRNTSLLYLQFKLPGVFHNNPYPNAVNGCLWTLPTEFGMYLIVFCLGIVNIFHRKRVGVLCYFLIALLFIAIHLVSHNSHFDLPPLACITGFIIGGIFYLLKDSIWLNAKIAIPLLIISLLVKIPVYFYTIAFAYWIFAFAYLIPRCGKALTKYGDFSYGLYIFGFPIQQYIISIYPHISGKNVFFLAYPITLVIAIISWYLIEKPMLKLKNKKIFKRELRLLLPLQSNIVD